MSLTLLKELFAGFLRNRRIARHFRRLPLILLAYMALTQAVKGFNIRKFGWQ